MLRVKFAGTGSPCILDTAGEFVRVAVGKGFCPPRHLNLPSLWPIGRLRESANSISYRAENC